MAERRMFAKKVTESDAFLDMPSSTQALYFHLNMSADDDGFVNNPRKIQRMVGASDDDFKLLIAKSFIITFDSGIIVIKHWKMHNYIQKDRYKPTDYIEERAMLEIKKNKAYTLNVSNLYTESVQDVSIGKGRLGKVSLGKVSLGKDRLDKDKAIEPKKPKKEPAVYFPHDEKLNQAFLDFMAMRKTLKNGAMTERAITMMINKINKLDNDTAIKMLEQSITNNWKDIYPLKEDKKKSSFDEFQDMGREWLNDRTGIYEDS